MVGRIFTLRNSLALACSIVLAGFSLHAFAQTSPPLLLRNPSLSVDKIAFLMCGRFPVRAAKPGDSLP
jgi:hypothetical protein